MTQAVHFVKQDFTQRAGPNSTTETELTNYTIAWSDLTGAGFAAGDDVVIATQVLIAGTSSNVYGYFAVGFGTTYAGRANNTDQNASTTCYPQIASRVPYLSLIRRTLVENENIYFTAARLGGTGGNTPLYNSFTSAVFKLASFGTDNWLYAVDTSHSGDAPTSYNTTGATVTTNKAGNWLFLATCKFLTDGADDHRVTIQIDGVDTSEVVSRLNGNNAYPMVGTMAIAPSLATSKVVRTRFRNSAGLNDIETSVIFGINLDAFQDAVFTQEAGSVTHSALDTYQEEWGPTYTASQTGPVLALFLPLHTFTENTKYPYGRIQLADADWPASGANRPCMGNYAAAAVAGPWLIGYASVSSGSLNFDFDIAEDTDISPTYSCTTQTGAIFSLELAATGNTYNESVPVQNAGTAAASATAVHVANKTVPAENAGTAQAAQSSQADLYKVVPAENAGTAQAAQSSLAELNVTVPVENAGTAQASAIGGMSVNVDVEEVGAQQTYHSEAETPEGGSGDADDGPYELGMRFQLTEAAPILGLHFLVGSGDPTTTWTARLWSAAGAPLASKAVTGLTLNAWNSILFDTPYQAAADTTYVISVNLAPAGVWDRYLYRYNYFSNPGPLHGIINGYVGLWSGTEGSFPANEMSTTYYRGPIVGGGAGLLVGATTTAARETSAAATASAQPDHGQSATWETFAAVTDSAFPDHSQGAQQVAGVSMAETSLPEVSATAQLEALASAGDESAGQADATSESTVMRIDYYAESDGVDALATAQQIANTQVSDSLLSGADTSVLTILGVSVTDALQTGHSQAAGADLNKGVTDTSLAEATISATAVLVAQVADSILAGYTNSVLSVLGVILAESNPVGYDTDATTQGQLYGAMSESNQVGATLGVGQIAYVTVEEASQPLADSWAGLLTSGGVNDSALTGDGVSEQAVLEATVQEVPLQATEEVFAQAWLGAVVTESSLPGTVITLGGWVQVAVSDTLIAEDWVIEAAQIIHSVVLSVRQRAVAFTVSDHSVTDIQAGTRSITIERTPRRES